MPQGEVKRLLHVITGLGVGGAENMLLKLIKNMPADHYQHRVVSLTSGGGMVPQFADAGIDVIQLQFRSIRSLLVSIWRLLRDARRYRADIVQGWMNHGNVAATLVAVVSLRRAALVWNVRQTIYDIRYERFGTQLMIRLGALVSSRADGILFNSYVGRAQHEVLGFRSRRMQVIPNGFDVERFSPSPSVRRATRARLNIGQSVPVVAMIARYHVMKDYPVFVRAMARLISEVPGAQVLLVGRDVDAEECGLLRLMDDLGIRTHCHAIGESSNVAELYPAIDVMCLTSSWGEGFPNVVGEAMACAVPCVVTDVGDAGRVVGSTGRVVAAGDPEAVAAAVHELLQLDGEERKALGARARQRIVDDYSIQSVAGEYAKFYDSL